MNLRTIATRIVESLCVSVECVYIDSQYRITEIDLNSVPIWSYSDDIYTKIGKNNNLS